MLVKVVRSGLMGPNEAVLPTMVPGGVACLCAAAAAAWGCPVRVVARVDWPASRTNVGLPRTLASLQGGLAAVRRGVSSDDLGPSV